MGFPEIVKLRFSFVSKSRLPREKPNAKHGSKMTRGRKRKREQVIHAYKKQIGDPRCCSMYLATNASGKYMTCAIEEEAAWTGLPVMTWKEGVDVRTLP